MKRTNKYQTITTPEGIMDGLFPTLEWFKAMDIDWKDRSVLDVGCASFAYGIEAIKLGASHVTGIDNEPKRIQDCKDLISLWNFDNADVYKADAESFPSMDVDIVIFSMILHWMKDPEKHIKRFLQKASTGVFIYRYPRDVKEPGYRPTVTELSSLLGVAPVRFTQLSDTKEQNIMLAVYNVENM